MKVYLEQYMSLIMRILMASKKYAYYNKGNKMAIVQQDVADVSSLSYGQYKSPNSYVEKGIEIEYSYIPIYRNGSTGLLDTDKFARFQCWGALDGYLTLFASGSLANDYSQVDMTSKFAVGDWIEIQGSGRWSGIHKVKSRSADGTLQLETSIGVDNLPMVSCTANIGSTPVLFAGNASGDEAAINSFKASVESMSLQNVYIWADDTTMDGTVENLGLYKAAPPSEWAAGQIKTSERHFSNAGVDVIDTASIGDPETGDAVRLFLVFREK